MVLQEWRLEFNSRRVLEHPKWVSITSVLQRQVNIHQ
jgi:hypothetical protein